jgi:small subunit ribosomal protein S17
MDETKTTARKKRRFNGVVTSVAGLKTIVVQVSKRVLHPVYRKYITRKVRYMAHDEASACAVGDEVRIEECRPLSARKRWRVIRTAKANAAA